MNRIEHDLTQGSVWRHLLRMSFPLMLSNVIQALYGVADMVIVGHYLGGSALSAVSVAGQITLFLTVFGTGLSNGSSVVISQNKGAGHRSSQSRIIGTTLFLFIVTAMLLSGPVILCRSVILRLLNTPAEAFGEASVYLLICGAGTVFVFGYNALSSTLRGLGNARISLYMVIIAAVCNLLLDLLFVGAAGWGVAGAALATILAQLMSFSSVLVFLMCSSGVGFPRRPEEYVPDSRYVRLILRTGLPSALQSGIVLLTLLAVSSMVNVYGLTVSAAYGIGVKLDNFSIMPRQAVAGASSAIIAQNAGSGDDERSEKTLGAALLLSLGAALTAFLAVQLFPGFLVSLFSRDPAILAAGIRYLRATSWNYLFAACMSSFNSLAIGVGLTSVAMLNSIIDSVVARIGLCLLLGYGLGLGLTGIYWALALAPAAAAIGGFLFYQTKKWKGSHLTLS